MIMLGSTPSAWPGIVTLTVLVHLVPIIPTAHAYWQEECRGDPEGGWALPQKHPLDCALRSLALEYASKLLHGRNTPVVHHALRLDACNSISISSNVSSNVSPDVDSKVHKVSRKFKIATAADNSAARKTALIRLGIDRPETLQLFVAPTEINVNSKDARDGSEANPFMALHEARDMIRKIPRPRPAVVVWLRGGIHTISSTFIMDAKAGDSGEKSESPIIYSSHPGESAVLSGGVQLPKLNWQKVAPFGDVDSASPQMYRASMPKGEDFSWMKGLFLLPSTIADVTIGAVGKRLTRSRYPNCDDITGVNCYTLNASGSSGEPSTPVYSEPHNVVVVNQHGKWMVNGTCNTSHGTPENPEIITVQHSDTAWRCPGDCGWVAYSNWRSITCASEECRFDTTYNTQYWNQQVSGGFYYNATAKANDWAPAWTNRTWSKASTGIVHMYHAARWGGWQFQVHSRNDSDHTIQFACTVLNADGTVAARNVECPKYHDSTGDKGYIVQGGWQEARGGAIGNQYTDKNMNDSYFIENIKEETDAEREWFYDVDENALYFIPPAGVDINGVDLIATKLKRIVQFNGTVELPLEHVHLLNITLAHSAYTYMDKYEIPSGGDWAIHRGGAIFADGAEQITIAGNNFDQIDGNGIFFSRYVRNSTIQDNDFNYVGDSAILLVGSTARGRIDVSKTKQYPAYNIIRGNHVNTVGVWVKQTAAYFKSVARENFVIGNVFHDGPRSGVNFNDGAMGGDVLKGNLLMNYVKESNDHGPFNSWDRQPFVYRIDEDNPTSELAVSPQTMTITNNFIFNFNFYGQSCGSIALDHDDESSQYNDTANVLAYGAVKTFDGMDRYIWDNLILYAANSNKISIPTCLSALQSTRNVSSQHTYYFNNHCVIPNTSTSIYHCGAGPGPFTNSSYRIHTYQNHFYFPDQDQIPNGSLWGGCWLGSGGPTNWSSWQSNGLDVGSTLSLDFSDAAIIAAARERLGL